MGLLRAFLSLLADVLKEMFTKDTNAGGSRSVQSLVVREEYIHEETAGGKRESDLEMLLMR